MFGRGGRVGRGGRGGRGAANLPPEELVPNDVADLLSSLGFSNVVCNHITQTEEITLLEHFLALAKDTLDRIFTRLDNLWIPYTVQQVSLLKALHHHIRRLTSQGNAVDSALIDRTVLIAEMDHMDGVENKETSSKPKQVLPKLTKTSKWRTYKAQFTNFLDGITGKKGVALTYVVRPQEVSPNAGNDPIYTTTHTEKLYQDDNSTVFRYLYGSVLGDVGEVYIRPYVTTRDGRGAFLAMDNHFSGGVYRLTRNSAAWSVIKKTKYTGKKASLDFATYRRIMDEAWADVRDADLEPKDEGKVQ